MFPVTAKVEELSLANPKVDGRLLGSPWISVPVQDTEHLRSPEQAFAWFVQMYYIREWMHAHSINA